MPVGFENDALTLAQQTWLPFVAAPLANVDNLDTGTPFSVIDLTPSVDINLTGVKNYGGDYTSLIVYNNKASTKNITLKNDVTSTEANRLKLPMAGDVVLTPGKFAVFMYGGSRWNLVQLPPQTSTDSIQTISADLDTLSGIALLSGLLTALNGSFVPAINELKEFARDVRAILIANKLGQ